MAPFQAKTISGQFSSTYTPPKLDTLGIISYDLTSEDVRYHPNESVERILEQIDAIAEDW